MNVTRRVFYKDLVDEISGDQKKLFSVTKRLLSVERDTQYPPFNDKVVLANKFGDFFAQKSVVINKTSLITWPRQCRLVVRSV